jgi:hypothetical protein
MVVFVCVFAALNNLSGAVAQVIPNGHPLLEQTAPGNDSTAVNAGSPVASFSQDVIFTSHFDRLVFDSNAPQLPSGPQPAVGAADGIARRTNAETAKLSYQQPIGDPAVETVDEQTEGNRGDGGAMGSLRDRWNQIRDPAITTVDQQTRGSGGAKKNWFDRLSIRGYTQFRFNQLLWDAPDSAPMHHVGDSSIADNQSFFIRRARIILSGDVSDHMYVYVQPDFAASVPGSPDSNYYTQLRDCYCDIYFDSEKVQRLRIGQSKVPYGWENLQSSSNRIPLDRNDGLNSSVRNERDLGLFYYYTPDFAQDLFKYVLDEGLKGSGNYGLFGLGVYNGQGGSFREQNDRLHVVSRLTVPFRLESGQIVEMSVQGYTGKYVVLTSPISPNGIGPAVAPAVDPDGYLDRRVAGTFVWYPQPIGFQTEWNVGRGPVLDEAQTEVIERSLYGGYAMLLLRRQTECYGTLFPFVKWNYYKGGYKSERNAPYSLIDEWELGLEWQFNPQMELTTQFTFADRTNTAARTTGVSYGQFDGTLLRLQFQMNY